jgi:hypothetical protein
MLQLGTRILRSIRRLRPPGISILYLLRLPLVKRRTCWWRYLP